MRIISQDGKINLPYDMTAIFVSGNNIQAVFAGSEQKSPYLMASYSSRENCEEAMKIMESASLGKYFKDFVESEIVRVGANDAVFRFPKDCEV